MITIDKIQSFCLTKDLSSEDFPFDNTTLVFKVLGKVFAVCRLEDWESGTPSITLKCDPNYALELRGNVYPTSMLLRRRKSPSLSHHVDGFSLFSTGLTDKRGQNALGSGLFSDQ